MAQRTLRNVLAGGAVIAALTLASPSPAHAATGSDFIGFWSWLAGSWGERVALRVGAGAPQAQGRHEGRPLRPEKQGGCVDPNGCANHQTTGTLIPSCRTSSDLGGCVDPNG
jgi:hypothetical protein